jgi:hypothetical protein
VSHLLRPIRSLSAEAAWLSDEFNLGAAVKTDAARLSCEMTLVRLHDSWARNCRDLVIRSACGNTTTLGGTALARSSLVTGGRGGVIPALLATYRRRTHEPKWFDVTECVDGAQRLIVGNLATIAAGLGANTSPAETLRAIRNFYAHRSYRTAREAFKTGLFSSMTIDVFELANPARAGLCHVDDWIIRLTDTLRAASQ